MQQMGDLRKSFAVHRQRTQRRWPYLMRTNPTVPNSHQWSCNFPTMIDVFAFSKYKSAWQSYVSKPKIVMLGQVNVPLLPSRYQCQQLSTWLS